MPQSYTTDTKFLGSTGGATANSTNKYQKYKSVELGDQLVLEEMEGFLNLGEPKKHERMCKLVDGDVLAKIPSNSSYITSYIDQEKAEEL